MKKLFVFISLFVGCMMVFVACGERTPLASNFMEKTGANSDTSVFLVSYVDEEMYEGKGVDIMVKCENDNTKLSVCKELDEYVQITIPTKDEWYSLTTLLCIANNEKNTENYVKFEQAVNTTWLVESESNQKISLKVVVGDKEENAAKTGYILTNKIDISKIFDLEIKQKQQ